MVPFPVSVGIVSRLDSGESSVLASMASVTVADISEQAKLVDCKEIGDCRDGIRIEVHRAHLQPTEETPDNS